MSSSPQGRPDLLTGPVQPAVLRLAGPMVLGLAAIIFFNLVDAFFVGQLGTRELAAMSFTFPVAFLVMSVAMGLGIGTTSVISRAIGTGDRKRVRRLTTDSLTLANTVVVVVALGGLATLNPIFRALGAPADMVPLIREYMVPWLLGVGFLVIPMVGNSAIRATGDTRTPSVVMVIAGLANGVLNPLLIFGLGPFPEMRLQGAAVASVLSWTITFAAALWVLGRRERLLDLSRPRLAEVLASWRQVLYVGIPAAATAALIPLTNGILTRLVASHGPDAVAAFGVGTRLEAVALIGINALAVGLTPFVGQNHGAGAHYRVRRAVRASMRLSLVYGLAVAVVLAAVAGPAASLFSDQASVVDGTRWYLWIIPFSFGPLGVGLLVNAALNATNRPLQATALVVLRLFVFSVPLALAGSAVGGLAGLFGGMAAANLLTGAAAYVMIPRILPAEQVVVVAPRSTPSRA